MSIGSVVLAVLAAAGSSAAPPASNESHNGAVAEPRRAESTTRAQKTFHFGVSLTQQGAMLPNGFQCHYCQEAEAGLRYWQVRVNQNQGKFLTQDGSVIVIDVAKKYDDGDPVKVQQNYEAFAVHNYEKADHEPPILALFGPCWVGFNAIAARVANQSNMVLITWAFDYGSYFSIPGPVMTMSIEPKVYDQALRIWNGSCRGNGCAFLENGTKNKESDQYTQFGGMPLNLQEEEFIPSSTGYAYDANRVVYTSDSNIEVTDLDGEVWTENFVTLVDINIPQSRWGYDAIHKVVQAHWDRYLGDLGPQDIAFVYANFEDRLSGIANRRSCQHLRDYTVSTFPNVTTTLFELADFLTGINELRALSSSVVVLCGTQWQYVRTILAFKAYSFQSRMVIFDKPLQQIFAWQIKAFNAFYFFDTLPMTYDEAQEDVIFTNTSIFLEGMAVHLSSCCSRGDTALSVGYSSMQMAAAGSLILAALRNIPSETLATIDEATSEAIMTYFRTSTTRTFWGDLIFDADGKRIGIGMTRQFVPLPRNPPDPDPPRDKCPDDWRCHWTVGRYTNMRFKIVDPSKASQCTGPADGLTEEAIRSREDLYISKETTDVMVVLSRLRNCIYTETVYPALGWTDKELQVYPCFPGCYFLDSKCMACAEGKFRSRDYLHCQSCPPGKFADVKGLSACFDCPANGDCSVPDKTPLPKAHYYPIPVRGSNFSIEGDLVLENSQALGDFKRCIAKDRKPHMVSFELCDDPEICSGKDGELVSGYTYLPLEQLDSTCKGRNRGVFCGQCAPGDSHYGFRASLRVCEECKSQIELIIRLFVIILFYAAVGKSLSSAAYAGSNRVNCLLCPLVRSVIQFAQVAALVFEATKIDQEDVISYFVIPFEIFIRPFENASVQCLKSESSSSFKGVQDIKSEALRIIPLSALGIVAVHILKSALRYSKLICKCCNVLGQAVAKCLSPITSLCFGKKRHDDDDSDDEKHRKKKKAEHGSPKGPGSPRDSDSDPEIDKMRTEDNILSALKGNRDPPIIEKEYFLVYGPGQAYASMHEGFALQNAIEIIIGEMVAMLFLLYPVVLRVTFMATNCRDFFPNGVKEERLLADYDVLCGSPEQEELQSGVGTTRTILGFGLIVFLFLFNFWAQDLAFSLRFRRMCGVIYAGYKPDFFYWQTILQARTLLFFYVVSYSKDILYRCLLLSGLFIISLVLQLVSHPYERTDRSVLHNLELWIHIVLIYTIWVGYAMVKIKYKQDDVLGIADYLDDYFDGEWTSRIPYGGAILFNYGILIAAVGALLYNQVFLPLEAIISQSETDAGGSSLWFHKFVKRNLRGMNELRYLTNKLGRPLMDISKLNEKEREFLTHSVTETMSACIDSGKIFHTWLLQNAINTAFTRALEARAAKLRSLYEKRGTRNLPLLRLGPFRLFYVSLRPPDIKTDIKAITEVTKTARANTFQITMDDSMPEAHVGVTVEEFHTALASVNVDILSRHPELYQQPQDTPANFLEEMEKDGKRGGHQVVHWYEGSSVQYLTDRLETAGTLEVHKERHGRVTADPEADYFLKLIQGEAEEMKNEYEATLAAPDEELLSVVDHLKLVNQEATKNLDQPNENAQKATMEDLDAMEKEIEQLKKLLQVHNKHKHKSRHALDEALQKHGFSQEEDQPVRNLSVSSGFASGTSYYDDGGSQEVQDDRAVATESRPKAEAKSRASPKASPKAQVKEEEFEATILPRNQSSAVVTASSQSAVPTQHPTFEQK